MEERKTMGSALVDVFDAAVVLVKSEINAVVKKVSAIAKEKGIGVVLLLGALAPLTLAAIFLILFVFYGLMRLGLGAWAAALLIGLLSLAAAGAMVMLGIQKLSADVDTDMPRQAYPVPASPDAPAGLMVGTPVTAVSGAAGGGVPLSDVRFPVAGQTESVSVQHGGAASHTASHGHHAHGHDHHDHHDDPNLQNPVVLSDAPGISVSTDPTYRDDMNRGGN